jgi:hypothetical protein
MNIEPLQRGDAITASWLNRLAITVQTLVRDGVHAVEPPLKLHANTLGIDLFRTTRFVKVRNISTTTDFDAFDILRISGPAFDASGNLDPSVYDGPLFNVTSPPTSLPYPDSDHAAVWNRFLVSAEPIPRGHVGQAIISGPAIVRYQNRSIMTANGYTLNAAGIVPGNKTNLTNSAQGARILWQGSGWAVIVLGDWIDNTISPVYCGVVPNEVDVTHAMGLLILYKCNAAGTIIPQSDVNSLNYVAVDHSYFNSADDPILSLNLKIPAGTIIPYRMYGHNINRPEVVHAIGRPTRIVNAIRQKQGTNLFEVQYRIDFGSWSSLARQSDGSTWWTMPTY